MTKPKVVAIVGPTASGKTALSIQLATQFAGEVISCDSRQVYKNLDIGTGKITPQEMAGIPHHLLDIVDINETYTAADFTTDAALAIKCIHGRGKLPIIAGGTFFYLDQLRGKQSLPAVAPNHELRSTLEKLSTIALYHKLQTTDSGRAKSIDPKNRRRLVRALEIVEELGKVPAVRTPQSSYEWLVIGIDIDKKTLRNKFKRRIEKWLTEGLVAETVWLQSQVSAERFAEFGFEYTLTKLLIDKEIDQASFMQKFIEKNWQYAKRQLTWLKRDQEIVWYSPEDLDKVHKDVAHFLA